MTNWLGGAMNYGDDGLPIVVVGAGPIGLAAAAHLLERGLEPLVLEAGAEPGAAVASWNHVRLFTPWRMNIDAAAERLLRRNGWRPPPANEHPTGAQLRTEYLTPLAFVPELASRLRFTSRVVGISRHGRDKLSDMGRDSTPFEILIDRGGDVERVLARAVIDASGAVENPNPLGASGLLAPGEAAAHDRIAYGLPAVLDGERARYGGKRILVVGSGHSAMNVVQDLATLRASEPLTTVVWAIRRRDLGSEDAYAVTELPQRARLRAEAEHLVRTGALRLVTHVEVEAVHATPEGLEVLTNRGRLGPFDEIVAATGFRPNLAMLRELRLALDTTFEAPRKLAALINPKIHTCTTVPPHGANELRHPEARFYLAGMKSYGRASAFLMQTGYEQVRSIAASLAGDETAAARVEQAPTSVTCTPASGCGPSCSTSDVAAAHQPVGATPSVGLERRSSKKGYCEC